MPPAKPSQVLWGLILGTILCRPKRWPTKYAAASLIQMDEITPKVSRAATGMGWLGMSMTRTYMTELSRNPV